MSVEDHHIIWLNGNHFERCLAYCFKALNSVFEVNNSQIESINLEDCSFRQLRESKRICVLLPGSEAYSATFEARTISRSAQKKIFQREIHSLTPHPLSETQVLVQKTKVSPSLLHFLQVRRPVLDRIRAQLDLLEDADLYLASKHNPELRIRHPYFASVRNKQQKSMAAGIVLCLIGLWSVVSVWEWNNLRSLRSIAEEETRLRTQVLDQLDEDIEQTALTRLAALDPAIRSPQSRLEVLAQITLATDDSTWWQQIEFDGVETHLTGRSKSATNSLAEVSNAFPTYRVIFSDSVSDTADGDQVFQLSLSPMETLR